MASLMSDQALDPYNQSIMLIAPDGQEFETTMGEFDYLRQYGIRVAINWASQIGASITLLLVLLLLTRREKRKSAIFIMNAMCLVLNAIRSILQCVWLTSHFYHPYALLAGDFSHVTATDRANSIASNTVLLILVVFIMISLSLQVWVVCITAKPLHRAVIMTVTTLVALVAIGFRFAVTVLSNVQTMHDLTMAPYDKIVTNMHITQAVAVWAYCCVFTFKLGHALIQRRRLRMNQFGPMQIVFIMGCQTMIIPAIFTSLNFYDSVPELASQSTTVICIFLPLSAIWAGLVANDAGISARGADCHQQLLKDQFFRSPSSTINSSGSGYKSSILAKKSSYDTSDKDPDSPTTATGELRRSDFVDNGIYIGRDWTVEKGEASDRV